VDKQQLKKKCIEIIDKHSDEIIKIGQRLYENPELGYKEFNSTMIAAEFLKELGLKVEENIAVTGCRASINEEKNGPRVAVIGELDAISCKEHEDSNEQGNVHACGHNIQIAVMLATALAIKESGAAEYLGGKIDFMAVPSEEFIEFDYRESLKRQGLIRFYGGKQELIYRGAFDKVDIAMMVHAKDLGDKKVQLNLESNGFIGKKITFIGKASHAGSCPEGGVNALNAAILAINNINAQRETFRDEDWVRVHAIITKGGDIVNVVPSEVKMEAYVRARSVESILSTNKKINSAISAAAMAIGAAVEIDDTFGYLPIINDSKLTGVFRDNIDYLGFKNEIIEGGKFTGSFDFGDISHIIPSIHPMMGGISGSLHAADYRIVDEAAAYTLPAKAMTGTLIDLLYGGAAKAQEIVSEFKPTMTKDEYIKFMEEVSKKHIFPGE